MTAELRTRKPTGLIPYPLVLLAGAEKTGKSYSAFALSASEKVGRTFVFDLGEGGADEYAEIGPYEVVEHNGTYNDIVEQLDAAVAVPAPEGKPNVIILDSITNLWELCKDDIIKIQAERHARKPSAPTDPTMDLWNRAKDRWRRVIDMLIKFDGIAIVTARGGEVTDVVNGVPTKTSSWKVMAEKNLAFDANVVIRTTSPGKADIIGVRSLQLHIPEGGKLQVPNFSLEKVVFDMMKAGGGVRDLKVLSSDEVTRTHAKTKILEAYLLSGMDTEDAKKAAGKLWGERTAGAILQTELEQLLSQIPMPGSGDEGEETQEQLAGVAS
jgi:hypothetical protein